MKTWKYHVLAGILTILIPCIFVSCNNEKKDNKTVSTQERAGIFEAPVAADLEYNPMNKIDIGFLYLFTHDGDSRFRIAKDEVRQQNVYLNLSDCMIKLFTFRVSW
jgi:hypothetical protein